MMKQKIIFVLCFEHLNNKNNIFKQISSLLYDDLRNSLFQKISEQNKLFMNFDYHGKVLFLSSNVDPYMCRLIAGFV